MYQIFVGDQNESVIIDGARVFVRDDYGISTDPKSFATKNCSACLGRGVINRAVLKTKYQPKELEKLLSDPVTRSTVKVSGKFLVQSDTCRCVRVFRAQLDRVIKKLESTGKIQNKKIPVPLTVDQQFCFVSSGYTTVSSDSAPQ